MQLKKYLLTTLSIVSVSAYATDTGHGFTVESSQVLHNALPINNNKYIFLKDLTFERSEEIFECKPDIDKSNG